MIFLHADGLVRESHIQVFDVHEKAATAWPDEKLVPGYKCGARLVLLARGFITPPLEPGCPTSCTQQSVEHAALLKQYRAFSRGATLV